MDRVVEVVSGQSLGDFCAGQIFAPLGMVDSGFHVPADKLAQTKAKLFAALKKMPGVEVPQADGAMYLFLRINGEDDSMRLATRLIEEVGLGLAPGRAFGPEGEGWLRWCYAADWKKIESGVERLSRFLSR